MIMLLLELYTSVYMISTAKCKRKENKTANAEDVIADNMSFFGFGGF
jgi:hypothetical protein